MPQRVPGYGLERLRLLVHPIKGQPLSTIVLQINQQRGEQGQISRGNIPHGDDLVPFHLYFYGATLQCYPAIAIRHAMPVL